MDELNDHFSERTVFLSSEKLSDFRRRERLKQKELDAAKKGVQSAMHLNDAIENLEVSMTKGARAQMRAQMQVSRQLEELSERADTLSVAQRAEVARLQAIDRAGGDLTTELRNLRAITQEVGRQQKEAYDNQALIVKHNGAFTRGLENARAKLKAWAGELFSFKTAFGLIVAGAKQSFQQLERSLEHQVPMMDTLGLGIQGITETAAAYGLSVDKLMETQNQYSQAILASAGDATTFAQASAQYLEQFKKAREGLYNLTGDFDKASELFGSTVDLLSFTGVKQSMAEVADAINQPNGVARGLQSLATLTKLSTQELANLNKALLQDSDIRFSMLGLDRQERKNRITDMLQYQKLLVSKGMEIDQAIEATKAMEKLTASVSPKDRYKQAARIRAIAGATGVGGGEDYMRLSMKPSGKLTAEEKEFMQSFATQMDQTMGNLLGSENIGAQMMGGAFQDVMGGALYDATVKAQSTAGLEGREINAQIVASVDNQTNQLQGIQEETKIAKQYLERIAAWATDGGAKMMLGAILGIGAGVVTIIGQLTGIMKYMALGGGKGPVGNMSGRGGAGGRGGRFGGVGGLLKKAGIAGMAYDAGKGIYDLTQGQQQTEMPSGWEMLSPMSWGMYGGNLVNKGVEWATGGSSIGSKLYDWTHGEDMAPRRAGGRGGNPNIANLVGQRAGGVNNPLRDITELQNDFIQKMKESTNPETKALAEQLQTNTEAMKQMARLMREGMEADKAAAEATKQNTVATKENTEQTTKKREVAVRSRGMDTRLPGSIG